jgi:hypothetical protein
MKVINFVKNDNNMIKLVVDKYSVVVLTIEEVEALVDKAQKTLLEIKKCYCVCKKEGN